MTIALTDHQLEWMQPEALAILRRKGRYWLKRAGVDSRELVNGDWPDLELLAATLWTRISALHRERHGDHANAPLVVGDLVDDLSDIECEIIAALIPEWVPSEGAGSMSPEVTAVFDLLRAAASEMEDEWTREEDE